MVFGLRQRWPMRRPLMAMGQGYGQGIFGGMLGRPSINQPPTLQGPMAPRAWDRTTTPPSAPQTQPQNNEQIVPRTQPQAFADLRVQQPATLPGPMPQAQQPLVAPPVSMPPMQTANTDNRAAPPVPTSRALQLPAAGTSPYALGPQAMAAALRNQQG